MYGLSIPSTYEPTTLKSPRHIGDQATVKRTHSQFLCQVSSLVYSKEHETVFKDQLWWSQNSVRHSEDKLVDWETLEDPIVNASFGAWTRFISY